MSITNMLTGLNNRHGHSYRSTTTRIFWSLWPSVPQTVWQLQVLPYRRQVVRLSTWLDLEAYWPAVEENGGSSAV